MGRRPPILDAGARARYAETELDYAGKGTAKSLAAGVPSGTARDDTLVLCRQMARALGSAGGQMCTDDPWSGDPQVGLRMIFKGPITP